jgi:hypothetical protein
MSAIFYYKMISKVAINEDYISITLKKLDENALPPYVFTNSANTTSNAYGPTATSASTTSPTTYKNSKINSILSKMLKRTSSTSTSKRRTSSLMKKLNF